MAYKFTAGDIDAMTRVVLGEAGSESDVGKSAVAHVVLNRLASKRFGSSPLAIVLAGRGTRAPQFEPTNDPGNVFYTSKPGDKAYDHAKAIVEGVISGQLGDPSGGATNFYSPRGQAALGRKTPGWASEKSFTSRVGGHAFYAPIGHVDNTVLLQPASHQADNDPAHSLGDENLPVMAYAGATATARPATAAVPAAAEADEDQRWSATLARINSAARARATPAAPQARQPAAAEPDVVQRKAAPAAVAPSPPKDNGVSLSDALSLVRGLGVAALHRGAEDSGLPGVGMTANVAAGAPQIANKLMEGAVDAATLPGDVATGKVNPLSDEGIGRALNLAGFATGGGLTASKPVNSLGSAGGNALTAYHGSPHSFDRFDASKINAADGSQIYGHGLYFAENEGVAKSYRGGTDAAPGHMYEVRVGSDPAHFIEWDKPFDKQSSFVQERLRALDDRHAASPPAPEPLGRSAQTVMDALKADPKYRGKWAQDEDRAWMHAREKLPGWSDESLASVVDSIAGAEGRPKASLRFDERGENVGNLLEQKQMLEPESVAGMKSDGVAGIRYPDGSEAGTRNMVVFDDKTVQILRKYGLAGLGIGGGAAFGLSGASSGEAQAQVREGRSSVTTPAAPADADTDFARRWGMSAETPQAVAPPRAAEPASAVDADFEHRWGYSASALAAAEGKTPTAPAPGAQKFPGKLGAYGLIWDDKGGRDPETGAYVAGGKEPTDNSKVEGSRTLAAASGVVHGVPVLGPALERGVAKLSAMMQDGPADQAEAVAAERMARARADNPKTALAGEITGGVVGIAPAVTAAPGAFGIGAGGMAARMAAGGATNALIGGADSAARGNSPTGGAALGGAIGALTPVVGAGVGRGVAAIGNRLFAPTVDGLGRNAANLLTEAAASDGGAVLRGAADRLGPLATMSDLGPSVRQVGQGLASTPGDARSAIFNVIEGRHSGATGRIGADLNQLLGAAEDPVRVTQRLRELRSQLGSEAYPAIHGQEVPVDTSSVVRLIDSQLGTAENPVAAGAQRRALQALRAQLVQGTAEDGSETLHTGSQYLHNLRQEVDTLLSGRGPGLGVEQASVSRADRSLTSVRQALDGVLKDQVPGMRHADEISAALARQLEAVESGTNVFSGGKNALHPTSFAEDFAAMPAPEQNAMRIGARGDINRAVGLRSNDTSALNNLLQGEGGWNRAKMGTVFGEPAAEGIEGAVNRERTFAATRNSLFGNSETAFRARAQQLLSRTDPDAVVDPSIASFYGEARAAGKRFVLNPIKRAMLPNYEMRDTQLGNAFALQGHERDQLIDQLIARAAGNGDRAALALAMDRGITTGGNLLAPPLVEAPGVRFAE